jgi:hypothetical protein
MSESWPSIPFHEWEDSCRTLHMMTQVVGKVSLALTPFLSEYWNVAFQVTPRGLTTGIISVGDRAFEVRFDFIGHRVMVETSDLPTQALVLAPSSVAGFYGEFMATLKAVGIDVTINTLPSEVPEPVRFDHDVASATCDLEYIGRWWSTMLHAYRLLNQFRAGFAGKSSPVQFFWGSFDLSSTRFSGRPAPTLENVPEFMRRAEDQENFAAGFWPGNPNANGVRLGEPAFYAYAYPAPPSLYDAPIEPAAARFDSTLGEFILPYEAVRHSSDPDAVVLTFLRSTYEAVTNLGGWNREGLEYAPETMK